MEEGDPQLPARTLRPEIWLQIFHKLPIQYVLRCKGVCKEWRRLISDPFFKSNYNIINPCSTVPNLPATLILLPPEDAPEHLPALSYEIDGSDYTNGLVGQSQPLPFEFSAARVTTVGTYNGLVALYHDQGYFCLFNPITKEENVVHVLPYEDQDGPFSLWKYDVFGVCHDPASNDYKVVVSRNVDSYFRSLLVSFKDSSWKLETEPSFEQFKYSRIHIGTTVQGAPHWMCYVAESIHYFDVRREEFGKVRLPRKTSLLNVCGLGALDGQLTVAMGNGGGYCDVWALKEYGNTDSWSKLFVIYVAAFDCFSILSWMRDDGALLIDVSEKELLICDVRKRGIRPVQSDIRRSNDRDDVVTYLPSFISPLFLLLD